MAGESNGWKWDFGIAIAFLCPGFFALWGVSYYSPVVRGWLLQDAPAANLGTAAVLALASLSSGLTVSAARWAIVDNALKLVWRLMGRRVPARNFALLHEKRDAFHYLVENHYRYYQYYANTLIAVVFSYCLHLSHERESLLFEPRKFVIVSTIVILLCLASHDTLWKFYERSAAILGTTADGPTQAGRKSK